jgi:hypothetical protein
MFTGAKVNYRKQLQLAFGDYCEVYNKTDNTSRSRTIPCLALSPMNNQSGSWEFYNLRTGARIQRSNWKQMVTTQAIIDIVNSISTATVYEEPLHPENLPKVLEEQQPPQIVEVTQPFSLKVKLNQPQCHRI